MVRLDPAWLYETRQSSDFADGCEDWSIFGTAGVQRRPHPDRAVAFALRLTKQQPAVRLRRCGTSPPDGGDS